MQITWKGQACFSITIQRSKQEQIKLVIDPYDPVVVGLKLSRLEADIALVTHDHKDHNNAAILKVSGTNESDIFLVTSPGEYEVRDVFIRGIRSFHDDVQGKERGTNTIYTIDAEGMRVCHMGDFGQHELSVEQIGQIGNVDILCIPVGGTYTVDGKQAAAVIGQIEPRMVIPMHYNVPGSKIKLAKVEEFLGAMGVKDIEAQGKITVKSRDLAGDDTKVTVLKPA